jgi:hypothetical protein
MSKVEPLTPNNRVAWGSKYPTVKTFLVFEKSGPVLRFITIDELLDIYDIELLTHGELKRFWKVYKIKPTKVFVDQIPVKVLQSLASRVTCALASENNQDDSKSINSDDSNAALHITNTVANQTTTLSTVYDTDDESWANELGPNDFVEVMDEHEEKAACNDDKEVDARDWDKWMVMHYVAADGRSRGVICNGNYELSRHEPFLKLLEIF